MGPGIHAGNRGERMWEELECFAYWASMRHDCLDYTCVVCNINHRPPVKPSGLLYSTVAGHPGEVVSLDVVPVPRDTDGYVAYILSLDKHSGWLSATPVKSKSTKVVIETWDAGTAPCFVDVETLVVDSDAALKGVAFQKAMKVRGIRVVVATAGHQQANFVERSVQHVKRMVRDALLGVPTKMWRAVLADVVRYYNVVARRPTTF
jgi:hypothetical protein